MSKHGIKELFKRFSGNPVITVQDIPYSVNSVFNAGATKFGDETLLLMRVEDRRGLSHLTVARSSDGFTNWKIDEKPTLSPDPEQYPEEIWGIEDPRITYLDEQQKWAVTYTSYSRFGPLVSLALTSNFKEFRRYGSILPPENKDAAIFPMAFNGRWAMIHRPVSIYDKERAHMWLSFSLDIRHWGNHKILMTAREGGWWDANKIGLSSPPLKTESGWLVLYHGVRKTVSGSIYRLGLALLDLDEPCNVLKRSDEWVFAPEEPYEKTGDVDDIVFPCGWIADGDAIKIYYGGADKCIAVAEAKQSDLLDWLSRHNSL